eukprot:UN04878
MGQKIQNTFQSLMSFVKNNNKNNTTSNNKNINTSIDTAFNGIQRSSSQQVKVDPKTGLITQFPQWLSQLLPETLVQSIKSITNLVITPQHGLEEYQKFKNQRFCK